MKNFSSSFSSKKAQKDLFFSSLFAEVSQYLNGNGARARERPLIEMYSSIFNAFRAPSNGYHHFHFHSERTESGDIIDERAWRAHVRELVADSAVTTSNS